MRNYQKKKKKSIKKSIFYVSYLNRLEGVHNQTKKYLNFLIKCLMQGVLKSKYG